MPISKEFNTKESILRIAGKVGLIAGSKIAQHISKIINNTNSSSGD